MIEETDNTSVIEGKSAARMKAAKMLSTVNAVVALALAWQAARFAMGDIGNVVAPLFQLTSTDVKAVMEHPLNPALEEGLSSQLGVLLDTFKTTAIWLIGFSFWLVVAVSSFHYGMVAARVTQVGWKQYRIERDEAQKQARIAAIRQTNKDRRRTLRRKAIELTAPRKRSTGILAFTLGLVIGWILF